MKKPLVLGACLVAFAPAPTVAQTGGPDVVLVRFSRPGNYNLRTVVTRGKGKSELSEIPKSNGTDKGELAASDALYKVLHQFYQEGYTLTNSTAEGAGSFQWVFTKGH